MTDMDDRTPQPQGEAQLELEAQEHAQAPEANMTEDETQQAQMASDAQPESPVRLEIPDALPVLPLRGGTVVFPLAVAPLNVGLERSIRMVDDVMRDNRFVATEPYLVARVAAAPDRISAGFETEGLRRAVLDLFRRLVALIPEVPDEVGAAAETVTDPRQVAYLVASTGLLDGPARQEILELEPVEAKLRRLIEILQHEESVRELGQQIAAETQGRMSKVQREYFLREQLRSIQQELGEGGDDPEIGELRRKIAETTLPEDVRREAERELERLATIPPASPEHGIIRTYLDWIAELPWDKLSGGEI
ncbi:MAG: lon, partial [Thermomicrobiales bacterium]|nr:lon [Thermomicrobiales bacterium]